jgi:hypothetical protein
VIGTKPTFESVPSLGLAPSSTAFDCEIPKQRHIERDRDHRTVRYEIPVLILNYRMKRVQCVQDVWWLVGRDKHPRHKRQ